MRVVFQSLVYVVPRANSAGTSCIRVNFTSSDTSRSGQGRKEQASGSEQQERARLTVSILSSWISSVGERERPGVSEW